MCDSTPIGELCETRVAMMNADTETFTNGHGENQEVAIILLISDSCLCWMNLAAPCTLTQKADFANFAGSDG